MSLINDAIKKANQANKERKPETAAPAPPETAATSGMHATPGGPGAHPASGNSGMFLIAGVVVFVLLGGLLLMMAMKQDPEDDTNLAENVQPVVVPDSTPIPGRVVPPTSNPGSVAAAAPVVAQSTIVEEAVVVEPAQPAVVPVVPEPSPAPAPVPTGLREFPEMKLQGIYYRLKNPSVMINGKTLWVGDLIEEVKVIEIQRQSVTLELDGKTKVLRLQ